MKPNTVQLGRCTIHVGDVLDGLRELPDNSVHCCVTSPPYWGLRQYLPTGSCVIRRDLPPAERLRVLARLDELGIKPRIYNTADIPDDMKQYFEPAPEIGLERTPAEYIAKMVAVFREVRRVLRDDGTCWVNMGDGYARDGGSGGPGSTALVGNTINGNQARCCETPAGLKPKDLIGMPWRLAFALQSDGWWLRSDIIWHKPNTMPESVTDRPTKSHEYIFLLTKAERYFFDQEAVKEAGTMNPVDWNADGTQKRTSHIRGDFGGKNTEPGKEAFRAITPTRNIRTVWTITTKGYPGAHFATFPPELPSRCIMAGTSAKGVCPECGAPWERVTEKDSITAHDGKTATQYAEGTTANRLALLRQAARERGEEYAASVKTIGWQTTCTCNAGEPVPATVLDPFGGSGTTAQVAIELGRQAILCELNPSYVELIRRRVEGVQIPLLVA